MSESFIRIRAQITGRVQGVGFRPAVYRHARAQCLVGWVRNDPSGVTLELEGPECAVQVALRAIVDAPPSQARIDQVQVRNIPAQGDKGFLIAPSARSGDMVAGLPPDLATCAACRSEILDSADRRYCHAFANCTDCGPRFTIASALPYDRERTAMAGFPMCEACRREFGDPLDRRFDAQPIACPACGPSLRLMDASDCDLPGDPIHEAARLIMKGQVVAMKSLGGFHLACDACRVDVVAELRRRKHRPDKPLAVMFSSLEHVRVFCELNADESAALASPAAPIVPLKQRSGTALANNLSPDTGEIGVFLPCTPLHHLLLLETGPLVMTSGNISDEPIAMNESELKPLLGLVADAALIHDRPILRRCDDSVLKITPHGPLIIRRARGFVPDPVRMQRHGPSVLACGGDLKNTFCVTRGNLAFPSQHVGDLAENKAMLFFEEAIRDLLRLLGVQPVLIAHDLHHGYRSTRFALAWPESGIQRIGVQHHHAHVAACMAEHALAGPVIGLALDGTGYGPDNSVWGGEILVADYVGFRRAGHFMRFQLPGGEAAIRDPVRSAFGLLLAEYDEPEALRHAGRFLPSLTSSNAGTFASLVRRGVNSPWTSSAGRLFDAVSAILGNDCPITYEGQAAIRLQAMADAGESGRLPYELRETNGCIEVAFGPMISALLEALAGGHDRRALAGQFHNTVADALVAASCRIREHEGIEQVVLSGGVFQNDLLLDRVLVGLKAAGFHAVYPQRIPPNDGGLALGQAAVALAHAERDAE